MRLSPIEFVEVEIVESSSPQKYTVFPCAIAKVKNEPYQRRFVFRPGTRRRRNFRRRMKNETRNRGFVKFDNFAIYIFGGGSSCMSQVVEPRRG